MTVRGCGTPPPAQGEGHRGCPALMDADGGGCPISGEPGGEFFLLSNPNFPWDVRCSPPARRQEEEIRAYVRQEMSQHCGEHPLPTPGLGSVPYSPKSPTSLTPPAPNPCPVCPTACGGQLPRRLDSREHSGCVPVPFPALPDKPPDFFGEGWRPPGPPGIPWDPLGPPGTPWSLLWCRDRRADGAGGAAVGGMGLGAAGGHGKSWGFVSKEAGGARPGESFTLPTEEEGASARRGNMARQVMESLGPPQIPAASPQESRVASLLCTSEPWGDAVSPGPHPWAQGEGFPWGLGKKAPHFLLATL